MPVSEQTFHRLALEDPEGQWELHRGRLRSKPGGTFLHNHVMTELGLSLAHDLDLAGYHVRINAGRLRHVPRRYEESLYLPDVFVFPDTLTERWRDQPHALEVYDEPVPLVVEVWEPPTDGYDADAKLSVYRERGDGELWRVHPFERMVTIWRRQPDERYEETTVRGGTVRLAALPDVTIDLDALFAPPPLAPTT